MSLYLKPERREKLIANLMRVGCSREVAELTTEIPEEQKDIYMFCHAECCTENIDDVLTSTRAAVYVALSTAFVVHIGNEAEERGEMDAEHFPRAYPFMEAFSAKVTAMMTGSATKH